MRKTKIVCTIGPACENEETIREMILAGMNVARLNFSHNTTEDHLRRIQNIKKVRKELGIPVAILLDTKGPEYRVGLFKNGKVNIEKGSTFIFTTEEVEGDNTITSVNYKNLHEDLDVGDIVLVNNGLLEFKVTEIKDKNIYTTCLAGGELSNRKSMSFPNKVLKQVFLSEQDKKDIKFGLENKVDYIACSFVSSKQDLVDVSNYIHSLGYECGKDVVLIAKIENRAGIDNIEEICEMCDGIMIARGDLGVEIPFEELPSVQKKLTTKCRLIGKRVITATEMLESMINNPRPTRAEINDVANAVYDGSSAVMLSGETAAGKYPVKTIKTMSTICEKTESSIDYASKYQRHEFKINNSMDAISHSVCQMAIDLDAKAIVVCSLSGTTARMVSRFRPPVDIIGLSINKKTWRTLSLSWGIIPRLCEYHPVMEDLFENAKIIAKSTLNLQKGDKIIITGANNLGVVGGTNTIRIETID
jgi:pyruvate kinase